MKHLLPLLAILPTPQDDALPAGGLPTAEEVLARHAAATASPEARAGIQNLRLRGEIEIPGMATGFGTLTCDEVHSRTAARQTSTSTADAMKMTMTMGTTGEWSWSTDPALGITIREGASGGQVKRLFALFRGASGVGMYTTSETVGLTQVDGRDCFELRQQPAGGGPETWFVDAETGLLARYDVALPNPEPGGGFLPMQFVFSDYVDVDGLMVARTRKQHVGAMTLVYRFETVEANAEFAPEVLAPPAEVQAAFDDPERKARAAAEADPETIVLQTVEEQPLASIRMKIPETEISSGLAIMLPEVWSHLTKVGAEMDGPPLTRMHGHANGEVDIEAGIPVKEPIEPAGRIQASSLPAGLTAVTWHVGPYTELQRSLDRADAWIVANGHEKRGGGWAIYWTDPGIEPDPAKWRTQILVPIRGEEPQER